jgi:manganese/zinc/iron transport system permease protein
MKLIAYFNPYYKQDFLGFFCTLLKRLYLFSTGALDGESLLADELQMLVLIGVAVSSSIVGTFLVLRRMTMLANSLSHTILLGIVLAYILTHSPSEGHEHQGIDIQAMLMAAVITGIVTTFLTEFLTNVVRLQEDASTGLVFSSLFALGIVLISMFTRNAHIGTEIVMGNVDALHIDDLKLVYAVLLLNLLVFAIFFKEFKITSFDSQLAKCLGISTMFFNYLLMTQVSATAIGAFRAVGVLMVLTFIVGPPLIARRLTDRLGAMLFISCLVGAIAAVTGVALSRHLLSIYSLPLSTGGLVVCNIALMYILALFFSPTNGVLAQLYYRYIIKKELDNRALS